MTTSYDLLLKVVTNLIKPEKSNPSFKDTTGIPLMKGYEDILQIAGYKGKEDSSMEYVQEPDKIKLSLLAAELLMAKLEIEQMNSTSAAVELKQDATSHQSASHFTSRTASIIGMLKFNN